MDVSEQPFFSVIIPVHNGGEALRACLSALLQSDFRSWEGIVIDDCSGDGSAAIATANGLRVLRTERQVGPGAARNLGAAAAQGHYLCFIDADCLAHRDTLSQLAAALQASPHVDAVFGSYDDCPAAPGAVAQYKNLLHHYVHQCSSGDASTFWAGCGAIRRALFLSLGGFDARTYPQPSIEDIDLGCRIKRAGGTINLVHSAQVTHLKNWTLLGLFKTDVFARGVPWTRMLLSRQYTLINDLNFRYQHRISVVAACCLLPSTILSPFDRRASLLVLALATALLLLNHDVYRFFFHKRGPRFTVVAIGLHWFTYMYSGISFACGVLLHFVNTLTR